MTACFIAIVDDEEQVRTALSRLCRAAGHETQCFASGQDFLASLSGRRPGCLLLDLHMPGMSGLQVLQALKLTGLALPSIIITAHDEPDARAACLDSGAAAYLNKPLDDWALLLAIDAAQASAP